MAKPKPPDWNVHDTEPGRKSVSSVDAAERRPHARLHGQHALAVGADHAHAAFGNGPLQLGLQLASLRAGLAEAGRQHHGERNAGLAAVADRLRHAGRRHGNDRQVARLVDGAHVGKAGQAVQLADTWD